MVAPVAAGGPGGFAILRPAIARVAAATELVGAFSLFTFRTFVRFFWPPLRLRATVYQIYVQGVRALFLAAVASAFTGMALALHGGSGLRRFGANSLLPQLTALSLIRELVPVMTGLVIGGRLGAGIAAELGTMAVTEQLDAVRVMGADPLRELVVPRVAAAALVLPLITVWSDTIGVLGAMGIAALEYGIGGRYFLHAAGDFIIVGDFVSGVGKAGGFGAAIALLGCWHGSRAQGGADGVGRATTQTVVQGALTVIVFDYFLSRILLPALAKGPGI